MTMMSDLQKMISTRRTPLPLLLLLANEPGWCPRLSLLVPSVLSALGLALHIYEPQEEQWNWRRVLRSLDGRSGVVINSNSSLCLFIVLSFVQLYCYRSCANVGELSYGNEKLYLFK